MPSSPVPSPESRVPEDGLAIRWLTECLRAEPGHVQALACLAVVRSRSGDREGLAAQAASMDRPEVADGRFHYLAAVCHLAAADYPKALEASGRAAAADPALLAESAYLAGWAHLHRNDPAAAATALELAARAPKGPSTEHARALLGRLAFQEGQYEQAISWWQALAAPWRAPGPFDEALRASVFLAGLRALADGRFAVAADRFREAGRLGLRDPRLGALLILALVRQAQRLPEAEAAPLLEQAVAAGCRDPQVAYLLAMAYKRQGKLRAAREALQRITPADADVLLQSGLLYLREGQLAAAERELAAAWEMDPRSYAAGYNLLRTRLARGQLDLAAALLCPVAELAPEAAGQRLLRGLHGLLERSRSPGGALAPDPALARLSDDEEEQLVAFLRGLGHGDTTCALLRMLAAARPGSRAVRTAHLEAVLVRARQVFDRGDWAGAEAFLTPLSREADAPEAVRAVLWNLLGCCACLGQEFGLGVSHFLTALGLAGRDARIEQNLALAHEWQGQGRQAEAHWNRFFERLDGAVTGPPAQPDYVERLAYEGLSRLANSQAENGQWTAALGYAQRAHDLRPDDPDLLQRLFYLYQQAGRPGDARQALGRLRALRPGEPQLEVLELELIDLRNRDGVDRLLTAADRILDRYRPDAQAEARGAALVAELAPVLQRVYDQLADRLTKWTHQIHRLPQYQMDWSAVHDNLRELRGAFLKLRRVANKCWVLARDSEQGTALRELGKHIDRKMEQCRALGG